MWDSSAIATIDSSLRTSSKEVTMKKSADIFCPGHLLVATFVALPALAAAGCADPLETSPIGQVPVDGESAVASLEQSLSLAAPQPDRGGAMGAVYVASNKFSGNEIVSFLRFADGSLKPGPRVSTGGLGSGIGQLIPNDPLGSQASLVADQKKQLLFAVNAGSNEVSVFAAGGDGLTLTDRRSSRGVYPVSLALDKDILYVLNATSNSIAGFTVDGRGHLSELQTCQLPALPGVPQGPFAATQTQSAQPVFSQTAGQVGFSPDGRKLVVVSKEGPLLEGFPFGATLGNGRIHVYDVDGRGALQNCGHPTTTVRPLNRDGKGRTPFDFAWSAEGQLLLTEVFGVGTSPTAPGSAVSSFALGRDGSLTPISQSVGSGQVAVCWIVSSGRYAFAANFLSDSISSYVSDKGLELANAQAATVGPGSQPSDMAVSNDGRFIYQLASGTSTIRPFAVTSSTGALTALTAASDGQDWSGYAGVATVDFARAE
jgi:6-phosphogluconolactonase (cycloisomerase 2 family)